MKFEYQKYGLKVGLLGIFVMVWIVVSYFIANFFQNQWVYWIVSAVIAICIMVIYYRKTEQLQSFNKIGYFEKTELGYSLEMDKKYEFSTVTRICAWESNLYGMHMWFLQIDAEQHIKIVSRPIKEDQTFATTGLYSILNQIVRDNNKLKQELDYNNEPIPYYYSVK